MKNEEPTIKQILISLFICIVVLVLLFWWHINSPMTETEIRNMEFMHQVRYREPGTKIVTKDNIVGTVVRKCWVGGYRYEVRLSDGSITYINARDFKY